MKRMEDSKGKTFRHFSIFVFMFRTLAQPILLFVSLFQIFFTSTNLFLLISFFFFTFSYLPRFLHLFFFFEKIVEFSPLFRFWFTIFRKKLFTCYLSPKESSIAPKGMEKSARPKGGRNACFPLVRRKAAPPIVQACHLVDNFKMAIFLFPLVILITTWLKRSLFGILHIIILWFCVTVFLVMF